MSGVDRVRLPACPKHGPLGPTAVERKDRREGNASDLSPWFVPDMELGGLLRCPGAACSVDEHLLNTYYILCITNSPSSSVHKQPA